MAGKGPKTGRIRTRKSSNGVKWDTGPLANSSSGRGSSLTSEGTSVEKTTLGLAMSRGVDLRDTTRYTIQA